MAQRVKCLPAMRETRVQSLGREDLLEKEMATHLLGESHGQRSLVGYSPQSREESYTTERLHFIQLIIGHVIHFFLSNLERFLSFLSYRSWKIWKISPQTLSGSIYFKPFFSSGTHILSAQGPVKSVLIGTALVAQWIRCPRLPMQGTRVQSPVQEDSTCHRATKPAHHNHSCERQLLERVPRACVPQQDKPRQGEDQAPQTRVAPPHRN